MADPMRVYGSAQRPADPVKLSAGAVELLFDAGEIRYLRIAGVEILRRVYVAVRDRNWGTIQPQLTDLHQDVATDSFRISFKIRHTSSDIDFTWDGMLTGDPSGLIRFEMKGQAQREFLTNRTGFCVLHPLSTCVGQPCTVEHTDGTASEGTFPDAISPHQPFKKIRAIRQSAGDISWRVLMEGETFEMEDQRNWSDGSFKTYCRPLDLEYPYTLKQGEIVHHVITIEPLSLSTAKPDQPLSPETELDLSAMTRGSWVPQIGLMVGEGFHALDRPSLEAIESLKPRHLRVDFSLVDDRWREKLSTLSPNLRRLNLPLEVALQLPEVTAAALREFAATWKQSGLKVARWIILPLLKGVTAAPLIDAAREALAALDETSLFAGGTDDGFVAINRTHAPVEKLDVISFSLNPQVHATDSLSLIENLQSHRQIIESAVKLSGGRPIAVTPITLKQRFNPVATAAESAPSDQLPASVDVRQMSLFAAAWTLGSLTGLCQADYLTYYQTDGWLGVIQGNQNPARPELFPSEAGEIFPIYHLFKAMLTFYPEHWSAPPVPDPLALAALLLEKPGRQRLLLANLTTRKQRVTLLLPQPATLTRLDSDSILSASRDPEYWLNTPSSAIPQRATIELTEYAIAQVDWSLL